MAYAVEASGRHEASRVSVLSRILSVAFRATAKQCVLTLNRQSGGVKTVHDIIPTCFPELSPRSDIPLYLQFS